MTPFLNLLPVFLVPTAREIKASDVLGNKAGAYTLNMIGERPIKDFYGTSNVETIDLRHSCLPAQALSTMLKLPLALKELRHEHITLTKHVVRFASTITLKSLGYAMRHHRRTLVRLAFDHEWVPEDPIEDTVSLCNFIALERLAIPLHVIQKPTRCRQEEEEARVQSQTFS